MVSNFVSVVDEVRFLTDNTFVVRFERQDMPFKAGQYVSVGLKNSSQRREYSIYSGEDESYLEILVREVLEGNVSLQLKDLKPGDEILVKGPLGKLKLDEADRYGKKLVFIASGTGIAPFHSFLKSYPKIDYKIIHGVRFAEEAYDREHYDPLRYVLCTTGDEKGSYHGRVTSYLDGVKTDPNSRYFICGNSSMIYSVYAFLSKKGVPAANINLEVYF